MAQAPLSKPRVYPTFLAVVLLLAMWILPIGGQGSGRRVTAVTVKGEVIEGTLKSATENTITLEVAGQSIQIPIASLQYLSFVGPLTSAAAPKGTAASPMDDALAAIADLQSAAETGVLRTQWADRLLAAVPRIRTFTRTDSADWPDVKSALEMAIEEYSAAVNDWRMASIHFADGRRAATFARALAAKPEERNHRETQAAPGQLALDVPMNGRLGFGDAVLADGRYVETFEFSMKGNSNVHFDLDCQPLLSSCQVIVTGADGARIEVTRNYTERNVPGFKTTKPLVAGTYRVQVAADRGAVGLFVLTPSLVK